MSAAVLVMAKAPRPGAAKTRLEPLLGRTGCARLQAALIRRAVAWADEVAPGRTYLAHSPPDAAEEVRELVGAGVRLLAQPHRDLGQALAQATAIVFAEAPGPLVVVGTDAPTVPAERGAEALRELENGSDACFGPAADGGYYLVALARPLPALFALEEGSWGGAQVLERSLAAARGAGLRVTLLAEQRDLDDPDDAAALAADPALPDEIAGLLSAAFT